ncbi:MAG TPA: peptidylprolyl isomerase [Polyangiaceae bacterium]
MWHAIFKEPFLQFLLLGTTIFALYQAAGGEPEDSQAVVVTPALVDSIRARLAAEQQRPPNGDELAQEVAKELRLELMYREGQSLGLDQDDVIKRRVAEKVEFLAADLASAPPIEERAVRAAYDRAGQKYVRPPRVSLRQLLFAGDDAKVAAERAHRAYVQLKSGTVAFEAARARATPTLLPTTLERADASTLARSYGSDFARRVMSATTTGWLLPFESGFGVHVVEVTEVLPSGPLPFAEAREEIRLDLERQQQERSAEALYQRLRAKYPIRLDTVNLPGLEQLL